MDAMIFLRQQVLVQILRRLQGGLLISKVYVNCLVSMRFMSMNKFDSDCLNVAFLSGVLPSLRGDSSSGFTSLAVGFNEPII